MLMLYLTLIDDEEDKRKFERLYLEYRQSMYYVANKILKDSYMAEDVVHQAFLRIVGRLDKIDETNIPRTRSFLTIIAEHIAIDIYRKRKRENWQSFDEVDEYVTVEQDFSLDVNKIVNAILRLPPKYSIALRLRYVQGYTVEEIADILEISTDNAYQRISRGKRKLNKMIEEGDLDDDNRTNR